MTEEKDIISIAEFVFSNPPKEQNSVSLQFDNYNLKQVHEDLLMFFTYGMKYKFSDENGVVNLKKISSEQLEMINSYTKMIGIEFHFNMYSEFEYDRMMNENFNIENKNNLQDYRFKLKSEDTIYVIYFSFLNNF